MYAILPVFQHIKEAGSDDSSGSPLIDGVLVGAVGLEVVVAVEGVFEYNWYVIGGGGALEHEIGVSVDI
jgi:hypothetical protein